MKKTYIKPTTVAVNIDTESMMDALATSVTPGDGSTNPVTKDEGDGAWVGSKENGDWDNLWED